jgi:hypothetical protein
MYQFFTQFLVGTEADGRDPPRHHFRWERVGKKVRRIGEPNEAMRIMQSRLLAYLANVAPSFVNAAARVKGPGAIRNASGHAGRNYLYTLDLRGAFPNTNGERLSGIIGEAVRRRYFRPRSMLAPTDTEWYAFLQRYCFSRDGGLIEGALTSPFLLDWYCEVTIDRPVREVLSRRIGDWIVSSRYVDDMTFSSRGRITRPFRRTIREIIRAAGYELHPKKTVVAHLPERTSVKVTGMSVARDGTIGIPWKTLKEIERMLYQAITTPLLFRQVRDNVIHGHARRVLDVARRQKKLSQLEAKILRHYAKFCTITGADSAWPTKVLLAKAPKKKRAVKKLKTKTNS